MLVALIIGGLLLFVLYSIKTRYALPMPPMDILDPFLLVAPRRVSDDNQCRRISV